MAIEKIEIFQDGEYKTYERDFAKHPLNLSDWYNAMVLDGATSNYTQKATSGSPLKEKDIKALADADINFVVHYFRDQFTPKQARAGIKPPVMLGDFNRWYTQSSGVMDNSSSDGEKVKK